MATHPITIDLSNNPDLVRLVEEVNTTKLPRILKQNSEPVAMLMPVGTTVPPKKKQTKIKVDYTAFRAAFGSWR